jgi:hypothetical protein
LALCCAEAPDFAMAAVVSVAPCEPDCDDDGVADDADEAPCDDPPERSTCASCASSDLISALSLSMAAVVASLDEDEPPPPPPPPPDFFALEVLVVLDVPEVESVDELDDVPLADVVLLSVLLAVEAVLDAAVPLLLLVVPV